MTQLFDDWPVGCQHLLPQDRAPRCYSWKYGRFCAWTRNVIHKKYDHTRNINYSTDTQWVMAGRSQDDLWLVRERTLECVARWQAFPMAASPCWVMADVKSTYRMAFSLTIILSPCKCTCSCTLIALISGEWVQPVPPSAESSDLPCARWCVSGAQTALANVKSMKMNSTEISQEAKTNKQTKKGRKREREKEKPTTFGPVRKRSRTRPHRRSG